MILARPTAAQTLIVPKRAGGERRSDEELSLSPQLICGVFSLGLPFLILIVSEYFLGVGKAPISMSSDDEAEHFVGDEQTLHGDSRVVADLTATDEAPIDGDDSDNDTAMPEVHQDAQEESVHTFEGHTGRNVIEYNWRINMPINRD